MRGVPRWLAVSAVIAVVSVLCAFAWRRPHGPSPLMVRLSATSLPADGFSFTEMEIHAADGRELRELQVASNNPHRIAIESIAEARPGVAIVTLQAGVNPGETTLRVSSSGLATRSIALRTTLDTVDSIGDGTPDFLRLHDAADRASFRRWFTLLAEAQYYRGRTLPPEIDDCAALLRFAYREALRTHDAAWAQLMALPAPATASDVRQYQYPYTPLEAALFRVRAGNFDTASLHDGSFAQFADVETLLRYNTFRVGRDLTRAQPGDVIFFRQDRPKMQFHAMIFLGQSQVEPGDEQFVAYHTGPTGNKPGEIRRLTVTQLINYPDARWRPVPSNPAFLGLYRWNILRGAE